MKRITCLVLIIAISIMMLFVSTSMAFIYVSVKSIKISSANVKIQAGKTYTLNLTILPANASNKSLVFTTANKSIATVDKYGKIKGIKPGNTVITVTSAANKKAEARCNVTVIQPVQQVKSSPIKIDWLAYSPIAQPNANADIFKKVEEKYNVKLKIWYVDKQKYNEIMGLRIASGEIPDFMLINDLSSIGKYVEQGVLTPVTDKMIDKMPTYKKIIAQYDTGKNLFNDVMYHGQRYALKRINLPTSYPTVIVWRTDWLKNVGITKIPETLKEFEDALVKFANNDPDKNGKKDTYGFADNSFDALFGAFGPMPMYRYSTKSDQKLHMSNRNGKVVFNAIQPEMKEALAWFQKMYQAGAIDPEFITSENKGGYWAVSHSFINGRIGLTGRQNYYHWMPPYGEKNPGGVIYLEMLKLNPNAKYGETFEIGTTPVGPKGKSGTYTLGPADVDNFSFTTKAVKDPKKVDVILRMIEDQLTDFDLAIASGWGTKGVNYDIDRSGTYYRIGEYAESGVALRNGLGVINPFFNPDFTKKIDPLQFEFADKLKLAGYIPEKVPSTEATTKYIGDLNKLALESYIKIITGSKSIDYFDEFVKTFREKGGDEIEKQVNEELKKLTSR